VTGAGAPPDGRGGPHVVVADLDRPVLTGDQRHHLLRVLRVRPGDPMTITDGCGRWRPARFGEVVEPAGAVVEVAPGRPAITIAFALVKGQRPELVVQKLTEIGVDRIVLLHANRSVVHWEPDRAGHNLRRLEAVARSAAQQSRQVYLPDVCGPLAVADAVSAGGPEVAMAEPGGGPLNLTRPQLLIGPEGGWTDDERDLGPPLVGLGRSVLRTETAAIVGGALLGALRNGVLGSHAE